MTLDRRGFLGFSAGAAAGAAVTRWSPLAAAAKLAEWTPGIKICAQIGEPSEDELAFVRQMGVEYVATWAKLDQPDRQVTADDFIALKRKVEAGGLKLWNVGNQRVHNMQEVTLNLPGRDQKIEEYKQNLRNLARAGITYTTYAHMGNGIWSSEPEKARGGAQARGLDLSSPARHGVWNKREFRGDLTHGRAYTKEEIWANYTYFIKAVAPVAEEVGVRIGIHPDDPPVPVLGGVPRCIFGNFDGYVRALEIANSPNVGVCLCCGTWLEGGKLMGKTVLEAIDHFGKRGKLWKIHFRNVTAPLPHFVETYVDDGYMDMYEIMRALVKVGFRGTAIPDHVPKGVGGAQVATAYTLGYMKALRARAEAEVGRPRSRT